MATDQISTRDQILHMLKTKGPMPVSDMAVELGITEMAVRRHLNTLERDNLVKSTLVRQAMGRPTNMYSLSEMADEMFPRNYNDLILELLRDLQDLDGMKKVDLLFSRRQERLEKIYRSYVKGSLKERIAALAELQNQKGYMVEWDKDAVTGDYYFKEHNCPIAQVAREFNQACNCELSLFRHVLETDVEQTSCMAKGGDNCVYRIVDMSKKGV